MKNLSIAQRLLILIVCAVVALIIVGFVGLSAASKANDGVRLIRDDSLVSISTLGAARLPKAGSTSTRM